MVSKVSVVLPCYRAGAIAAVTVTRLKQALTESFGQWEIVIVDDGGNDLPGSLSTGSSAIRILRLPSNRGKGAAVRAGMLAATGDVRIYTDVDLPYGAAPLSTIAQLIRERGFHAVIGDRTLPGAVYRKEVAIGRRLASTVFSTFVGRVVTGGFFDTQCGLKGFRGDVAEALFAMSRIDRFAFDVELVYVCLKHRLDIKRIPVQLENNNTSSVRLIRDSVRGFSDVFRIKYHQLLRHYRSTELERIIQSDFDEFVSSTSVQLREPTF